MKNRCFLILILHYSILILFHAHYNKSNNSKVRKRGENCLAKEVMTRRSADNEYFHKDFHISCDLGISYVGEHYGDDGVREYIRNYTANYLAPLSNQIREEGFQALEQYLKQLYETEKAPGVLKIRRSDDEIEVTITACPAIAFMRESGHTPSKWYIDTTTVLYETIAQNAGAQFELIQYDEQSGAAQFRMFSETK